MKNNDTGELELVLGNRQLLSGFFVVALLFGVAFAMGYIVGRNSTPSPKLQAETAVGGTVSALPDARPGPGGAATTTESQTPASSDNSAPGATAPANQTSSTAADTAPAQPAPTTQPARDGPAAAEPATSEAGVVPEPAPGTYWQVTAIPEPQAQVIGKALRDKGFHVTLTPGTKNLTRVLVGPYPDRETQGRAKSDLESAGFHPVIMKKE
ncbi:MAG: SPOR domain-containing protein [Acidobacteriia bacterium]|nr:SPOR domain-containing protein [Terriglobia bacterium]MBV9745429.1 SPOR domain-containing protein [Terriglobia bacterium]